MARIPWVYMVRWTDFVPSMNAFERALRCISNVLCIHARLSRIDSIRAMFVRPMEPGADAYSYFSVSHRKGPRELIGPFLERLSAKLFDKVNIHEAASNVLPKLPDLIFNVEVWRPIEDLNSFDCVKSFYAGDVPVSVRRYFTFGQAYRYDHVFVSQKSFLERFRDMGCRDVHWLPLACEDQVFRPPRLEEIYDISFAGGLYQNHPRTRYLMALMKNFNVNFVRAFQYDLAEIYRRSKIIFHRSYAGELNLRVFEAMGAGSLLVCYRCDGLSDLFQDGKHLVCYDDEQDLVEKVRYYLKDDKERRAIAHAGQEEVLKKHTYHNRVKDVLSVSLGREISQVS